jgi:hypothetical protein
MVMERIAETSINTGNGNISIEKYLANVGLKPIGILL